MSPNLELRKKKQTESRLSKLKLRFACYFEYDLTKCEILLEKI